MLRGITVTSIIVTIAAVIFLVLDINGIRWNARLQVGDHDATIISGIAAVFLWLVRWRAGRDDKREQARARDDENVSILIRTLADAVPPRSVKRTASFPRAL